MKNKLLKYLFGDNPSLSKTIYIFKKGWRNKKDNKEFYNPIIQ